MYFKLNLASPKKLNQLQLRRRLRRTHGRVRPKALEKARRVRVIGRNLHRQAEKQQLASHQGDHQFHLHLLHHQLGFQLECLVYRFFSVRNFLLIKLFVKFYKVPSPPQSLPSASPKSDASKSKIVPPVPATRKKSMNYKRSPICDELERLNLSEKSDVQADNAVKSITEEAIEQIEGTLAEFY